MVSDTPHEESLSTQSKRQGFIGDLLAQMSRKDQGVAGDGCKQDSVQGSHLCFLLSGASFSPPAGGNAAGISASPSRGKGAPGSDWRGSSPPPPRMTPGGPGSRQRMGSPFGPCGEGGMRRDPYLEGGLLRHPVAAPELLITKEYQTQVGRPHGWCGRGSRRLKAMSLLGDATLHLSFGGASAASRSRLSLASCPPAPFLVLDPP